MQDLLGIRQSYGKPNKIRWLVSFLLELHLSIHVRIGTFLYFEGTTNENKVGPSNLAEITGAGSWNIKLNFLESWTFLKGLKMVRQLVMHLAREYVINRKKASVDFWFTSYVIFQTLSVCNAYVKRFCLSCRTGLVRECYTNNKQPSSWAARLSQNVISMWSIYKNQRFH